MTKAVYKNWPAIIMLLLILTVLLIMVWPSHASTTVLTGTVKDATGNPINGTLVLQLPIPAQDTTTNTAVANTPVTFRLVNGVITGGVPLYDIANLQPQNLYYSARAYDSSGALVLTGNYSVTGGTFNLGAAVPTSITTNNVSFVNPAVTNASNAFCCTQTFSGQISSTVLSGTAPFAVQSNTLVPLLNVANLNGVTVSGTPAANQVLTATSSSAANWQTPAVSSSVPVAAAANLTAQQTNLGATTLVTPGANGFYRFTCYIVLTQAATTSSTLPGCNYGYTDSDSGVAQTSAFSTTSTANVLGTVGPQASVPTSSLPAFFARSGVAITYSTVNYASSGATVMQYAIHVRLEGPF